MLTITNKLYSNDKMAIKYIQSTEDNYLIETTYVDHYKKHIICFSSQIGCSIGCNICYSGLCSKFYRNLTEVEMYEQCINIIRDLDLKDKPILFSCMGVGEPLLNYNNVISVIKHLYKEYPRAKYALATTGIKPLLILKLIDDLKEIDKFKLTISLHSVNEEIRRSIISNSILAKDLVKVGKRYEELSGKEVEWNYVLLNGINDSKEDAINLIKVLGKKECIKLNQFNPVSVSNFRKSSDKNIKEFKKALGEDINYEYYETNGVDIMGACGQMICKKNNKVFESK